MPYMTGIVDALKAAGLKVETVSGWQTRGSSSFNPKGVVDHWTAGPRGSSTRPSLNVVTYGRTGLPGPLCNVYLDRRGVCVVVAAGRANHAGSGGWNGLVGNSSVFGIEAECGGPGDWTSEQRSAYPILNAALLKMVGRNATYVCGHNEWAPTRKIDIRDWPLSLMRSQTAVELSRLDKGVDDVSREDAFLGTFDVLAQGAGRETPTGRQIGDNLRSIVTPSVRVAVAQDLKPMFDNLIGAIAALSKGEAFDEAKLLKGVEESARKGTLSATTLIADAVKAALADVRDVDEQAVADNVVKQIGKLLGG